VNGRAYFARYGAGVLEALAMAPDRVPTESLVEIATREPLRIISVLEYLKKRQEIGENWSALTALSRLERMSPWTRIWILQVLDGFNPPAGDTGNDLYSWAEAQLKDDLEVVRAEAAWSLSGAGKLPSSLLSSLVAQATDISLTGLAATAGRIDTNAESEVGKALSASSKIVRAAYAWGRAYAS